MSQFHLEMGEEDAVCDVPMSQIGWTLDDEYLHLQGACQLIENFHLVISYKHFLHQEDQLDIIIIIVLSWWSN